MQRLRHLIVVHDQYRETCVRHLIQDIVAHLRRYLETSDSTAASFVFPYQRLSSVLVHFPRGAVVDGGRQQPRTSNCVVLCSDVRRGDYERITLSYNAYIACCAVGVGVPRILRVRRWWQVRLVDPFLAGCWLHNNSNTTQPNPNTTPR